MAWLPSMTISARWRRMAGRAISGNALPQRPSVRPDARAFLAHDRDFWCLTRAVAIGPACAELIERLLADRIVERLRAAQNVLRLATSYPAARVEAACARALVQRSASSTGR